MKIYTRTGDSGETGLVDGSRVGKDAARVGAYGDVDELNAVIGLIKTRSSDPQLSALLVDVQRDLFALGAQLADPSASIAARKTKAALDQTHVQRLEREIDVREAELPELRAFLLPGGSKAGAWLHLARTVCRRAERAVVALGRSAPVDAIAVVYLNRLSDLLFVLARHANRLAGIPEDTW